MPTAETKPVKPLTAPQGRGLRRIREIVSESGWKGLWFKLLGETVHRRMIMYTRPVYVEPGSDTDLEDVDIRRLEEDDIPEYLEMRPHADEAEVRRRMAADDWLIGVRHEGQLAFVAWLSAYVLDVEYLKRSYRLGEETVVMYEAYTHPDLRGHGVAMMVIEMNRYAQDYGITRMLSLVMPENTAPRRALEKFEFVGIGTVGWWKLGPLRRDYVKLDDPGPPPLHI